MFSAFTKPRTLEEDSKSQSGDIILREDSTESEVDFDKFRKTSWDMKRLARLFIVRTSTKIKGVSTNHGLATSFVVGTSTNSKSIDESRLATSSVVRTSTN